MAPMLRMALVGLVLLVTPATSTPDDATLERETRDWHEGRKAKLTAEDGWLSLVGLTWLKEGDARVGSAPEGEIRLPKSAPAHLGTFSRQAEQVSFTPAPTSRV